MTTVQHNAEGIWCDQWSATPYWLDDTPDLPPLSADLPKSVDVLVIGAGFTGLNAAIETARGGRDTLVVDAGVPGAGCSTRNGGQISTSIKPSFDTLAAKYGPDRARAIRDEGKTALEWIEERIRGDAINCDFERVGRFHAAHSAAAYESLTREAVQVMQSEGIEAHAVPRDEQRREIGTGFYHGGVVYPRHAALHPGRYHHGLMRVATGAGARVMGDCAVTNITPGQSGFDVTTSRGTIHARDVVVATNGYTGDATPWLRRRVIPIGSYIIATEPLPADLIDRLFPTRRIISDTRKVVYYYRTSPDRSRVLFGGRVSANETNPKLSGPKLYAEMCRIFPELGRTRISHSWMGTVAYTFDELAHTGRHDGVIYAMGYCGSGVSMASYLGFRAGQKVLGRVEGRTAFDDLPFPTRPLYSGNPWFLPPLVAWYRWRDRMQTSRGAA